MHVSGLSLSELVIISSMQYAWVCFPGFTTLFTTCNHYLGVHFQFVDDGDSLCELHCLCKQCVPLGVLPSIFLLCGFVMHVSRELRVSQIFCQTRWAMMRPKMGHQLLQ